MRRRVNRLRLLLVASLATVFLGCATWEDYGDSGGAGKADTEVAIFKAHLANTRRIVSAPDERIEYQYDPAQTRTLWSASHPRVRLLPGQYTITAETWPFGSLYKFDVDLKAGHKYKVETSLCTFECVRNGKPYRHDRWIQDLTTRERISGVVSECYVANQRRGERRRVPCPDEQNDRDSHSASKASAEVAIVEEGNHDSLGVGKAKAKVAIDEEDERVSSGASKASAEVAIVEQGKRDSLGVGKANARMAVDEEDERITGGASKATAEAAMFKAHPANTRRIVSAPDGRIAYEYNPELKRTQRSAPHPLIQLLPGQYTITARTWPFGSLYEFEVYLKAGHLYKVETSLCSWECISIGEPYRHDRWIQDLTTGERVSGVVSECYLGKKRRRERRRVPCPND